MRGVCGSRAHWLATVSALALLLGRAPAHAQTAPAAPSGLTAGAAASSQVNLTWTDNSDNEFAFAVWRQGGGAAFARVAALAANTTRFTDNGLTPGATYTYEVRAINNAGASAWSNQATVALVPPAAPSNLAVSSLSAAVALTWTDNSNNETAFAIWRQGRGAGWARVGVVGPDTTAYTDTNISANTTYTYQVRAINNVGASDWSNQVTAATSEWAAALAAAEGGLNWEIGRIDNRLWDKNDSGAIAVDGSGSPTLDLWPTSTGAPPATASTVTLMTDASGNWTQRFLVGTSINPYSTIAGGWFIITAEGQVRAADGHIVRRRVQNGGANGGPTLFSLFDSAAIFAFSPSASSSAPAWSMNGSCSVVGGCGSNGLLYGIGGPAITVGPLGLWGPNA